MYRRISLTTDFSEASRTAFLHALALALHYRSYLDILHVREPGEEPQLLAFPQVRTTLQQWGIAGVPAAIDRNTSIAGIHINKVDVPANDAAKSLARFALEHGTDLLVAASHGRLGLNRLLKGSITEELVHQTQLPALIIGPEARPFVSPLNGSVKIDHVVFPVAQKPAPDEAYDELVQFLNGANAAIRLLHVRRGPSRYDDGFYQGLPVSFSDGEPAAEIMAYSRAIKADLLVMATQGSHGLKDALFGTTTGKVLAHAPCPVLVVPAQT